MLLVPMPAEFVIEGEYRGVELLTADCRRISLQVLAYDGWRDRRRRANHADVLARSPDVAVGRKDLCGYRVDLWSRRNRLYAFQALSLPPGFLA